MRGGGFGGMRGGGFGRTGGFSGFRSGGGFGHRPVFRSGFGFRRFPRTTFFPAFYGGFGFYDPYPYAPYPYPYAGPYAGYAPDYGYPATEAPQVIINQGFQPEAAATPVVREYVSPAPEERKYEQPLYLIAFQGGAIQAVLAYWVEGTVLHYVTMDHEQKQTPLASIDRALSERLNGERNVNFQLPR